MNQQPFSAIPISKRVYWVGAIDWNLRDFHGYSTSRGTSYNAYLIDGPQPILVDTVKAEFAGEMLSRIASVIDPDRIETVVSHHAEMDHTGALPEFIRRHRPKRIVTSAAGVAALQAHFEMELPIEGVRDGATLDVGEGAKLTFYDTKMVHWPESMFSYLDGDQVLFSQDGFGMHLASFERFVDQLPADIVAYESAKYFANILMPFPNQLEKLIARLTEVIGKAKVIATDHGPIWRRDLGSIVEQYRTWASRRPRPKLVIAYDTMWQSTATMARAIAEAASGAGIQVKLLCLGESHRSDIATELLDAAGLMVGSPNLNGQMYPTVADLLTYLRGLKPRRLVGAAFGSFGWSQTAITQVDAGLREMGVEVVEQPLLAKFVPHREDLLRCSELGIKIAQHVKALCSQ